jgi:hypothetical protein
VTRGGQSEWVRVGRRFVATTPCASFGVPFPALLSPPETNSREREEERGRINSSAPERCLCQYSSERTGCLVTHFGPETAAAAATAAALTRWIWPLGCAGLGAQPFHVDTDQGRGFLLWKSPGTSDGALFLPPAYLFCLPSVYMGEIAGAGGTDSQNGRAEHIRQVPHFQFMRRLSQDQEITIPFHSRGLIFCLSDRLVCVNISSIKKHFQPLSMNNVPFFFC